MCTELILAFIYFITIFFVNYFLFTLLKNTIKNSFYFLKIEKILKLFKFQEKRNLFYYLISLKTKLSYFKVLNSLNSLNIKKDVLIIGYMYSFLIENIQLIFEDSSFLLSSLKVEKIEPIELKKRKDNLFFSNKLYLKLLQNQYLNF